MVRCHQQIHPLESHDRILIAWLLTLLLFIALPTVARGGHPGTRDAKFNMPEETLPLIHHPRRSNVQRQKKRLMQLQKGLWLALQAAHAVERTRQAEELALWIDPACLRPIRKIHSRQRHTVWPALQQAVELLDTRAGRGQLRLLHTAHRLWQNTTMQILDQAAHARTRHLAVKLRNGVPTRQHRQIFQALILEMQAMLLREIEQQDVKLRKRPQTHQA